MPFPVGSVVSWLQRIGRALRLSPGKTHANIYVFGDTPGIKNGKWQKLQRRALQARDPLDPIDNLKDRLEDLEQDNAPEERIAWTRNAVAACEHLLGQNMRTIAELVAEGRFPQKYNRAIRRLMEAVVPTNDKTTSATDAQIAALERFHGFRHEDAQKLNEREAAALLVTFGNFMRRDSFIIQRGPHAGKHISDTPPMYRRHIRDPDTKALWLNWIKAGRPHEQSR